MTTQSSEVLMITSVDEVRQRLNYLRSIAAQGAFEQARVLERTLWDGVLEAIASCNAQAGWIAAEALKSKEIDFPRG